MPTALSLLVNGQPLALQVTQPKRSERILLTPLFTSVGWILTYGKIRFEAHRVITRTKLAAWMKDYNPKTGKYDFTEVHMNFTTDLHWRPFFIPVY